MSAALATAIEILLAGNPLDVAAAESAILALLDEQATPAQTAALLTLLAARPFEPAHLEGAVRAVRSRMIPLPAPGDRPLLDTCGTGGDRLGTLNISTGAAIIAAAAGARVVKHGNRAASSPSGSTDVLDALGVPTQLEPHDLLECLKQVGIVYLHAPRFHPGLAHLAPIRRQLGFRTIFNLVGPLCNPASPSCQLVGCAGRRLADLIAHTLRKLNHLNRSTVVCSQDGLDEFSLQSPNLLHQTFGTVIHTQTLDASHLGLPSQPISTIKVDNPEQSARLLLQAFEGQPGPARDYLTANAALAIHTAGLAESLNHALQIARETLDSRQALRLLDRWRQFRRP